MTIPGIPLDFFEEGQQSVAGDGAAAPPLGAIERISLKDDPNVRETTRTIKATIQKSDAKVEALNEDERIVLLIDECHRSQAGDFHSYMMGALPNAAKIGFTALRANIAETLPVSSISEEGEKGIQLEEQQTLCCCCGGFACRGTNRGRAQRGRM